jgi:hypothetical protein
LAGNGICQVLALVYRRASPRNPDQEVEFSSDVGSTAGLVITIDLAHLYHCVPFPAGVNVDTIVDVDLEELWARLLTGQQ